MTRVREPAVAGLFYPEDPHALSAQVDALLAAVPAYTGPAVKALIAPHAGYAYSGPVAASAFATVRARPEIERVLLLGPAHTVRLQGLSLPTVDAYRTPLGTVPVDMATGERLVGLPFVMRCDRAHAREHALEVELPFLQSTVPAFTIVPIVVGDADPADVAELLAVCWGGAETLVVVSSDLSHYLSYGRARELDQRTAGSILALRPEEIDPDQACGRTPVCGLLHEARRRGLTPELLDLRSSGDTAGSHDRVVGYGAFAFA